MKRFVLLLLTVVMLSTYVYAQDGQEFTMVKPSLYRTLPTKRHKFFTKKMIVLLLADAAARGADGYTTRNMLEDPCKCHTEMNLPYSWVNSDTRIAINESLFTAAVFGGSYLLYRIPHMRHFDDLPPATDATFVGKTAYGNMNLPIVAGAHQQ